MRCSVAARRARAMRCTCSSAGPQPTLGQRSPGETNPSAAQRASSRARLAPAARGSTQPLPLPPLSQTPASDAGAGARARERGTRGRTPTSMQRIPNSLGAAAGLNRRAETGGRDWGSGATLIPSERLLQAVSRRQPRGCGCLFGIAADWVGFGQAPPTNT